MDFFDNLVDYNIDKIYPSKDALVKALSGEKKLRIYLGIDPSSSRIHLGNAIPLRKLAQFQSLGHQVILLIGDFTGMIGDPTGRDAARVPLTHEEVLENAKSYQKQASKIINFSGKNKAQLAYNSHWLAKLNFEQVVKLTSHFTVSQMLERDMFQKRLKEKKPISVHEFLYPIMQGYDSVALDIDVEIGGTDQTFNMMVGRELQRKIKSKEKYVLTLPLLEGTDARKMSKSFGNTIDIDEDPSSMYGKVMSLKDSLILKYFEMTTDPPINELKTIREALTKENPINVKKKLAKTLVTMYHSEKEAQSAEEEFEKVVQKGEAPEKVEEFEFKKADLDKTYLYFLTETGLVESNSEASRLAAQGAIVFDGKKVENVREEFSPDKNEILIKAGKRKFIVLKFV
ncbi:MAG TPA: tyrosine--tRNA ligase [Candidatus Saccharimonadales bacterium]|nr:tyrosine--tRNA ligase [Candidatus Saccharimonadales bacterium]